MAANALVKVQFTLDITEEQIDKIAGRMDDGSDAWREEAYDALESYMGVEFGQYLDQMTGGGPEVEADIA